MATIKILANARRAYRTGGLSALIGVFVRRLALSEQTDAWMRWCMSRYVELRGNMFSLDGRGHARVRCGCGQDFTRWVTPEDAAEDLLRSALLAFEN